MTALEMAPSAPVATQNPLVHVLRGKALKRWNENRDMLQARFSPESLQARKGAIGRDINCLDLADLHHEDPDFGTPAFPKGVPCRKCGTPIETAWASAVILPDGTLLEKNGERVERGSVRVILEGNHYVPAFFCEGCRFAETVTGTYTRTDGTTGTFSVKIPKSSYPSSYRRASAKAKRLNVGKFIPFNPK